MFFHDGCIGTRNFEWHGKRAWPSTVLREHDWHAKITPQCHASRARIVKGGFQMADSAQFGQSSARMWAPIQAALSERFHHLAATPISM